MHSLHFWSWSNGRYRQSACEALPKNKPDQGFHVFYPKIAAVAPLDAIKPASHATPFEVNFAVL